VFSQQFPHHFLIFQQFFWIISILPPSRNLTLFLFTNLNKFYKNDISNHKLLLNPETRLSISGLISVRLQNSTKHERCYSGTSKGNESDRPCAKVFSVSSLLALQEPLMKLCWKATRSKEAHFLHYVKCLETWTFLVFCNKCCSQIY
jgi:hypothetical protein